MTVFSGIYETVLLFYVITVQRVGGTFSHMYSPSFWFISLLPATCTVHLFIFEWPVPIYPQVQSIPIVYEKINETDTRDSTASFSGHCSNFPHRGVQGQSLGSANTVQ